MWSCTPLLLSPPLPPRMVVQPWHCLTSLNLSHNTLAHPLHSSLLLLHSLTRLDLSHNLLEVLDLTYLTLPCLRTLNASHNKITEIDAKRKVGGAGAATPTT